MSGEDAMQHSWDESVKNMSDAELTTIRHKREVHDDAHVAASRELQRRQEEKQDARDRTQVKIRNMTVWVLIITILVLLVSVVELAMLWTSL